MGVHKEQISHYLALCTQDQPTLLGIVFREKRLWLSFYSSMLLKGVFLTSVYFICFYNNTFMKTY